MKGSLILIALIIISNFSKTSNAQVLNTIAKTGFVPYSKNWHASEWISGNEANDVTYDSAGNVYYTVNSRIVKIDRITGAQTIIAGQSWSGYSGDGGLAKDATLNNPIGIVVDRNNDVLFIDKDNFRIRKINQTTGVIQTIAGTGISGVSGNGGLATNAKIAVALGKGIELDTSGNILFIDNLWIRKINVKTGIISTYAGGGFDSLSLTPKNALSIDLANATDIAINKNNDVYIVELYKNRIGKIRATTNLATLFAGSYSLNFQDSILAIDARLYAPNSICFDDSNNLYVLDYNNTLRKINLSDNKIYNVVGIRDSFGFVGDGLSLKEVLFSSPRSIAYNSLNKSLIINDYYNFRLRELSLYSRSPLRQSDYHFCLNDPENPLTAIGKNLKWYNQPLGGVPMLSPPIPKTNVTDTFNYFVSQTIDGMESPRSSIVVSIHAADTLYKVSEQIEFCYNTPTLFLYQNVYLLSWFSRIKYFYDSELLDSVDISTDEVKLRTGTKKYFAQAISSFGCKSNVDSFDVIVRNKLPIPEFQSQINKCQWDPVVSLEAKGENIKWYVDTLYEWTETGPRPSTGSVYTTYFYLNQTDSLGCTSDFGILKFTVNPKPKEYAQVKSPVEYCQGDVAEKFFAIGSNLSWFNADSIFMGNETPRPSTKEAGETKTLVCVQNEYGCKGIISTITTKIKPKPTINSTFEQSKPFTGLPITLYCSSDIGKAFIWNTGDTNTSLTYKPKNEGRHYFWVQSTSELGCKSDTSWHYVDILPTEYWNSDYEVYPNPFVNRIHLSNINLNDIMSVNLYSLNGIKVFQSEMPLKSLEINIPDWLLSGEYLLEVNTVGSANPTRLVYKK